MRLMILVILLLGSLLGFGWTRALAEPPADAGTYHGNADRSGMFVVPGLTPAVLPKLHRETTFAGAVTGNVYAQPLYYVPPGATHGVILVATSSNYVFALDSKTGSAVWHSFLGNSVTQSSLPCGDINPLGVTGTPTIGPDGIVYLDAMVAQSTGPHHMIFALSMKTGAVMPGYPIDVAAALKTLGIAFDSTIQNQRGALAAVNGKLYVPYGGLAGDCQQYHGWVVGADLITNKLFGAWATRAPLGGIWGQSGVAFDGKSLLVATGNTRHTATWGDGEAVIRLPANLSHSANTADYFSPAGWLTLDHEDQDLGGTGPVPLDVPDKLGTQALVVALGKDGYAYLLNRNDLGGIGKALINVAVSKGGIISAPAVYPVGSDIYVAFHGTCASGTGMSVIGISAGSPPGVKREWCSTVDGGGAPIVTTTDGRNDPIVWVLGAQGDNELHGFSGVTGKPLFTSEPITGASFHHFQTILVADKQCFIAGDNHVYAFGLDP